MLTALKNKIYYVEESRYRLNVLCRAFKINFFVRFLEIWNEM